MTPTARAILKACNLTSADGSHDAIQEASILTTTYLIYKSTVIAVMPQSIAGSYAAHGPLKVLPCHIQHNMESFGSITFKDDSFTETSNFFL